MTVGRNGTSAAVQDKEMLQLFRNRLCPLCDGAMAWLLFETDGPHGRPGQGWKISLLEDPRQHVGPGVYGTDIDRTALCRNGHPWPLRHDQLGVVRIIGTVAAGKSYQTRRMVNQIFPPWDGPVSIEFGTPGKADMMAMEYYTSTRLLTEGYNLLQPTLRWAKSCAQVLNDVLTQIDGEAPGKWQEFLTTLLLPGAAESHTGEERGAAVAGWGRPVHPVRLPTVTRVGEQYHHFGLTAVADLAGEELAAMVGAAETESYQEFFERTDAILWLIDPATMDRTRDALAKYLSTRKAGKIIKASMRPDDQVTPEAARANMAEHEENTRRFLDLLIKHDNPADRGGKAELIIGITKCDLVLRLLELQQEDPDADGGRSGEQRRWSILADRRDNEKLYLRATQALQAAAKYWLDFHTRVLTLEPPVRQLLEQVAASPDRAAEIAGEFLDHFADPDEFWSLVETDRAIEFMLPHSALSDRYPEVPVEIADLSGYLEGLYLDGRLFQMRDVATTVVGAALLSLATLNKYALANIYRRRPVRFALTTAVGKTPRSDADEIIRALTSSRMIAEESVGLLQLYATLVHKAAVPPIAFPAQGRRM